MLNLLKSRLVPLIRSLLIFFPWMNSGKIFLQRSVLNLFRIPFDKDFEALRLFPETDGALYLDVGGNNGFAIDAILMNTKNCRVCSFEPNPTLAARTGKRFAADARVEVKNIGLGKESGEFALYLPVYRGYPFTGLASLKEEEARSWLKNNRLYFYRDDKLKIVEFKCQVCRLDDLNLDPFFLKLDVQGFELEVLMGAGDTLKRSEPVIMIEAVKEEDEIVSYLATFGYKLFMFENNAFVAGKSGRDNSFLMTDNKIRSLQQC